MKHRLYNLTTAGMTEYNSGEELRYVADGGWITYQMSSYHIRYTPETTDNAGDLLTARAPVAEGTKYRYEYFLNGGE